MKATKYLLAKYIPDLPRFEPRNIGVIVWCEGAVEARLLAEYASRPGEVDGRSIPPFVTSSNAYRQWVRYWRNAISGPAFKAPGSLEPVFVTSPEFLEALVQTSRGNFVISETGELLDRVTEDELPGVADQLFATLVETNAPDEPRDLDFDEKCDQLLTQSGLAQHRHFHSRYSVNCRVNDVDEEYVFSHAIANGKLERLFQRWPLPKRKKDIQRNLHDITWRLEQVVRQNIITPDKTVVLVDVSAEQQAVPEAEKSLRLLGSMSRLVNLQDEGAALAELELAAQLP
jgi:hypothetical protein